MSNSPAVRSFTFLGWVLAAAVAVLALGIPGPADASRVDREDIRQMVVEEAVRSGVPVSLALAVAKVESNYKPRALSSAGARGVMQIMPKTGKDLYGVEPDELWDPRLNIRIGVDFLRSLKKRYGRWDLALSHYNGGSAVGTPPNARVIPATQGYVDSVLAWQRRFERQDTVVAMAEAVENRQASTVKVSDSSLEYWMFDDPYIRKDWRHYLKVADYWLGKRKTNPDDPASLVEPQEAEPQASAQPGSEFPVETLDALPERRSDNLRRDMMAHRLQFRDRLNSGSRPWFHGGSPDGHGRFGYR